MCPEPRPRRLGRPASRRRNVLLLYLLSAFSTHRQRLDEPSSCRSTSTRLGHPLSLVGTVVALIGLGSLLSRLAGGAWYRLSRARWLCAVAFALMGCSTGALGLGDAVPLQAFLPACSGFTFGLARPCCWRC